MTEYLLIGLGSNIDPENNLLAAISSINDKIEILECSTVLINPPCGETFHFPFHNQILLAKSDLRPSELKGYFEDIEINLGREPKCPARKLNDRTIDIDILHHASSISQLLSIQLEEAYNKEIMSNWALPNL